MRPPAKICCRSIAKRRKATRRSPLRARNGKPRRTRAAGARVVAAGTLGVRRRQRECVRRDDQHVAEEFVLGELHLGNLTFSASQPLYRPQNVVAYDQAKEQVSQSDYTLGIAQQDLIIRTAVAYFDVLLAEFNVELAEQQKIAVAEQLAQAKRNFEVGTATITDTNEAQAKYDSIIATEIQARNDLDRRRTALMAIIGACRSR